MLDILFSALIHISIIVLAEGLLFFHVLAKIETQVLDDVVSNTFNRIISPYMMSSKQFINKIPVNTIEEITGEREFINYHNSIATNNFYKLMIGLAITISLMMYYMKFASGRDVVNLGHIAAVVILIFVFIAIYELVLIFTTVLKMDQNEQTVILKILDLIQ